ncbi:carboxymuconolactone decarboxylase family protein [Tautonia marina]|uniref:carboxymuconolactone decarboxylase family protein n=1 Tax=Tautonia marina TaxID=2653855 RepID=UPI0012612AC7|nr:carboxymuconolactone decarboxylase family protein [Tautonia marina]
MQESDPNVYESLARGDLDGAPLPRVEHALLQFVETITKHAYRVTDEQVERLREMGWTDEQLAECVYIAALFAFFNRVADAFGIEFPTNFGTLASRDGDPQQSDPTEGTP